MTPRVRHAPRACAHCGQSFAPQRVDALFCGGACRVSAHRKRRRVTVFGQGATGASCNGFRTAVLTPELRAWLRREIDSRTRERLRKADSDELARDRALFAGEVEA